MTKDVEQYRKIFDSLDPSDYIMEEISMLSYNRDVYVFETRYTEEKRKKTK